MDLMRDFEREAAMAKKLGGPPRNDNEFTKMMQATYTPDELKAR